MQNLTTTLISDIKNNREIILPAGQAKFNWIDIENIGEIAAILLLHFSEYKNQIFEITGPENANFEEVTAMINKVIDSPIKYKNVNPIHFYFTKKQEGKMESGMIIVMIFLHFLPRFQNEPKISDFYENLTGKKPMTLKSFIEREKKAFDSIRKNN